ncbi:hypothetical protein H6G54_07195 [Anabaena cylindrica FACHB-243]|uniref:hypothetical protein n=1 Tax=Anabaena TaxID=1163 RepID=UPI0002ECEAB1|nr:MULTISPECIES: hypothetical protein [Anabaena]MBD2417494.1 hypothetical protein [Anabaena cylindrica FACHB-243]MBY5307411.1 hypothetical protein [Anabaena sp. CCAP 1446/1C]MCM2407663.1 hypothetical protein [Anabaena sp. CCAP 1446/1C]
MEVWRCDRCLWIWGSAIAVLGMWGCDRSFGDVGSAIAKRSVGIACWGVGSAIAFTECFQLI